jgi:hypothetical protein
MSWKPSEAEIIDYLYDNMKPAERVDFAKRLKEHPDVEQELNEISETLNLLPVLEDEEVIPTLRFDEPIQQKRSISAERAWLLPVSIAASITLLLITGYLTQFRLSFNQGGIDIGFYNTETPKSKSLTKEEIDLLIADRLDKTTYDLREEMGRMKTNFISELEGNKRITEEQISRIAQQRQATPAEDEQILNYMAQLRESNREMMQNFYKVSVEEQQGVLRNILFDYSAFLEDQRKEDLQIIQTNLLNIKNSSELKQEETDKLLANIISTVNNKYSLGQ